MIPGPGQCEVGLHTDMETDKKMEERIGVAEERFILPRLYPRTHPLRAEIRELGGEPVTYETAMDGEYRPVAEGDAWGRPWDTAWFRIEGEVPVDWAGSEVVALVDLSFEEEEGFGREGLVWMNGKPVIAVSRNRKAIPLLNRAEGGEQMAFAIEAAANPAAEWHWGGTPHGGGAAEKRLFGVKTLRLAERDEMVFQLLIDFRVCREAMRELAPGSMRRERLRRTLDQVCRCMEVGTTAWVPEVRDLLRPMLDCCNGSTAHRVTAVGHAHIDTAWCWPLRETIRKCARTFSTALAYMERYPDYRFSCSQPVQYLWMKEHYPDIYAGIRDAVRRGQWEVIGSMWVEPDCNIPSGESLVRQILHGKRFFEQEFGVEPRDLWLPDVFGYSAALPQILKRAGIDWFLTQKISWNDTNRFPHHSFLWEGIDGTRIFSHFPPADTYNGRLTAAEIAHGERQFAPKDRASMSLLPFGQGDGGGGPTIEMIERARRWKDFEGMPRVEMGTVRGFFEEAEAEIEEAPLWRGELYLEMHRGTYTSQGWNKWMNRHCELLLRDAEFFQAVASVVAPGELLEADPCPDRTVWDLAGHGPDKDGQPTAMAMDRAWKLLLLNQFHDILPGSSIGWVYEDSRRDHGVVEAIATAVRDAAITAVLKAISADGPQEATMAFNTLGHARCEVVTCNDGSLAVAEVPSCGYAMVAPDQAGVVPAGMAAVQAVEEAGRVRISNGLVECVIAADGGVDSVVDLESSREVLDGRGNEFHLLRDYPNHWNAWDIDQPAMDDYEVLGGVDRIDLLERGPLQAVVELERRFGASRMCQRIVLRAGSRRIDFETVLDWRERHRVLKAAFPVAIRSEHVTCEIQFGHVRRPVHRNTSWDAARFEVCAQRWIDLSEGDFGVALMNDGRFGHDIQGNMMRLTLAKGAHAPDPDADLGEHRFTYSLYPHPDAGPRGGVVEAALELNVPLHVRPAGGGGSAPTSHSWLTVDRPGIMVEAFKVAEDGEGLIVRCCEALGSRGRAMVHLGLKTGPLEEADLLERPVATNAGSMDDPIAFQPFEIRTFRIGTK